MTAGMVGAGLSNTSCWAVRKLASAAARLTAWGLLYALLVVFCWPAFIVGLVVMGCGWVQGRGAGRVLADLTDTAVDLYTGDLAERLGLPAARPLTAATGEEIIRILRGS